jgi:hypothetical protein
VALAATIVVTLTFATMAYTYVTSDLTDFDPQSIRLQPST